MKKQIERETGHVLLEPHLRPKFLKDNHGKAVRAPSDIGKKKPTVADLKLSMATMYFNVTQSIKSMHTKLGSNINSLEQKLNSSIQESINSAMELWHSRWAVEMKKQIDHVISSKLTPIVNEVTDVQTELCKMQKI